MTAGKRLTTWIIISLIIQCSLYLYLDKVYFATDGNIQISNIDTGDYAKAITPKINFKSDDTNISLSYDCSYTAYMENGVLKVFDTNTGKERTLGFSSGVQILSYKWLTDSNIMMIAERLTVNGRKAIQIFSYDADSQEKKDTNNYVGGKKVNTLPSYSSNDKVDFESSPDTGVLYTKVSYSKTEASVFRLDRNETLTRQSTTTRNIGKMCVASDDDQLVYEDLTYDRLRTNYKTRTLTLNGSTNLKLLGNDGNDNFYVSIGNTASQIYYGKLSVPTSSWNKITLSSPVISSNIVVTPSGNVYNIDSADGKVVNLKNNKVYNFNGEYIGINDSYISYKANDKLLVLALK